MDTRYLLIEGKINIKIKNEELFIIGTHRLNIFTFWDTIWLRYVSSIVMLYDITENVNNIRRK